MMSCFSARSLPRETSSSMDSHIPFESGSLAPGFLLVVAVALWDWPWERGALCMVVVIVV